MTIQEKMEFEIITKFFVNRGVLSGISLIESYSTLVLSRHVGGSGFMTVFRDDPILHILPNSCNEDISPCEATLDGKSNPFGFVIMIKHGTIEWLEGFSYDGEPWPEELHGYRIHDI